MCAVGEEMDGGDNCPNDPNRIRLISTVMEQVMRAIRVPRVAPSIRTVMPFVLEPTIAPMS